MPPRSAKHPSWLCHWMEDHHIALWGTADLTSFSTPLDDKGKGFPGALSFALPMQSHIMASIQDGPNQAYADEYARVNQEINQLSSELADVIKAKGFRSQALAASIRSDTVNIKGDFPHKTAATRAGIGWIGRHCQLVTRPYGPWVRLGTVLTDMELLYGPPKERSHCGKCRRCVDACPAGALSGKDWFPGIPRQEILDVRQCDQWKKDHYLEFHNGHNCGICSAVCPHGAKGEHPMTQAKKRSPFRTFISYMDLSREYYAAYGYTKPYKWVSHATVPFARLEKPLSECRVGLMTTTDLDKLPGENKMERHLLRKVYAHPMEDAPEHFYTQDLQWDQETTHTDDNESFMPLNSLAEKATSGKIGSAAPRFYGAMTDYSQGKTSKTSAPQVLEFCREDGVDALILPAL